MTKKNTLTIIDLTWLHVARRNVEEVTKLLDKPAKEMLEGAGVGFREGQC
ncbi:hypothetical protein Scep_011189 [Stephania cephalantha]|uniref:Uncharacterized protein n=1 Tax=Stephania cephalantha TaxID=152367 RepID=A0AAP0JCM3_9MAGN